MPTHQGTPSHRPKGLGKKFNDVAVVEEVSEGTVLRQHQFRGLDAERRAWEVYDAMITERELRAPRRADKT